MLVTVVELPEFIKRSATLLDAPQHKLLIDYLAANPRAGDLMEGTGGVRKLRWERGNRGKSGGVRVIHYFRDERMPLFLLTMFGKNERANLTQAERNQLAKLVAALKKTGSGDQDG